MITLSIIFQSIAAIIGYRAIRITPSFITTSKEQLAEEMAHSNEIAFWAFWTLGVISLLIRRG